MEEKPSRAHLKRPLQDDNDDSSNKPPMQKRVRFPKGKKVKPGDEKVDVFQPSDDGASEWSKPHLAAKERAMRRKQTTGEAAQIIPEESSEMLHDISAAEVHYEDDETLVDDGIQIEPFNLDQEREEGYFDEQGHYVEYVNENEIKDAWLDSVEVDTKLAEKGFVMKNDDSDIQELSSKEIGKIKRRIANVLEPGETVLQGLRRLKGTSSNKKEKMSAETKLLFDQLTEDAMKLMENGDYNVYDEKQEVFQREAEGYERLAWARIEGTSMNSDSDFTMANDFVSNGTDILSSSSKPLDTTGVSVNPNADNDPFDIFAEDDENGTANPTSDESNLGSDPTHDRKVQQSESGGPQNDYVFDEASGYYYSSSLGYYYDPSSGLYCCAASGQWYSYNEATSTYDEVHQASSEMS
ncbi:hypothetical protein NMG60_11021453 [Bertholletia excelsa]